MPIFLPTFLLICAIYQPLLVLGFAPTSSRTAPASFRRRSTASLVASSAPRDNTALSSAGAVAHEAEQHLARAYPRFCWILRQNPAALQRMRDSRSGFAVLAPSDEAIVSMGPERLRALEAAGDDPGLRQIVSRIAAYHVVSAPMSREIMASYNVIPTAVGELPVEVAPDGTLWVNGRQVIQTYQFEGNAVENYQDKDGNAIGIQSTGGARRCIIHEVDGFVCPEELWHAFFSHFEASGTGAA